MHDLYIALALLVLHRSDEDWNSQIPIPVQRTVLLFASLGLSREIWHLLSPPHREAHPNPM